MASAASAAEIEPLKLSGATRILGVELRRLSGIERLP
jgi:hypothetical protein